MKTNKVGWWLKMADFDIDFGPWIAYGAGGKGDKEELIMRQKMEELKTMSWSPFNGFDAANVFIFCMAYAFAKGRVPNKSAGKGGNMPASAFKRDMRDFMKAVAIAHTKDLNVITDPNKVVKICEGFASASFLEVYNTIKDRDPTISAEMILDSFLQEIESARK